MGLLAAYRVMSEITLMLRIFIAYIYYAGALVIF